MFNRNPFAVLGLSPSAVRDLNDEEIAILVRGLYRTLVLIHHPDKGGSEKANAEINWAKEELDQEGNKNSYSLWKEAFLKQKKDRVLDLETKITALQKVLEKTQDALRLNWTALVKGDCGEDYFSLHNHPPMSVLISPFLQNVLIAIGGGKETLFSHKPPASSSPVFRLDILTDGRLLQTNLKRVPINSVEDIPVGIPEKLIFIDQQKKYFLALASDPEILEGVEIIGSYPSQTLDEKGKSWSSHRQLVSGPSEENFSRVREGFPWEVIKNWASEISPIVKEKELVIAVKKTSDGRILFPIFGNVIRLWKA